MGDPQFADRPVLAEGDELPVLVRGPIDRTTLALFAGASHDHVRLHIDIDFARAAGMDDVFAHGMLTMAYLAQALGQWARQDCLRGWSVRFTAIVPLHATISCKGRVTELFDDGGERRARLRIGAWTDANILAIDGDAVVAIDQTGSRHG